MQERALYSIKEARELLGGISRNGIYALLRTGERHWMPTVHLWGGDRSAHQPIHDHGQPLAGRCAVATAPSKTGGTLLAHRVHFIPSEIF